jgi:hypothetical protein
MDAATDPRGRPFALDVIRAWPDVAREAAYQVILVHGPPDDLDEHSLRWDHLGPWKRVAVCAFDGDEDPDDVIESVIDAAIPDDRRAEVDDVATEFRVTIEPDGELSVRGPDLHVNAVTLNVIHDIANHGLPAQEARERWSRDLADLRDGHPPADADELHFADDAPHGEPRPTGSDWTAGDEPRSSGSAGDESRPTQASDAPRPDGSAGDESGSDEP